MTGLMRSLALLLTAAVFTAQAKAAEAEAVLIASAADGRVVRVQPIDAPGNPYAGKYTAYDRWFVDNYAPNVTEEEKKHFGG
jgi:hypothetical protein